MVGSPENEHNYHVSLLYSSACQNHEGLEFIYAVINPEQLWTFTDNLKTIEDDNVTNKQMMDILEKKLGTQDIVIVDIISQVEKMKNITTEKGFTEFVEQLEKIKWT